MFGYIVNKAIGKVVDTIFSEQIAAVEKANEEKRQHQKDVFIKRYSLTCRS